MAESGNTMWNGRYGADESARRKNYERTADVSFVKPVANKDQSRVPQGESRWGSQISGSVKVRSSGSFTKD